MLQAARVKVSEFARLNLLLHLAVTESERCTTQVENVHLRIQTLSFD